MMGGNIHEVSRIRNNKGERQRERERERGAGKIRILDKLSKREKVSLHLSYIADENNLNRRNE